MNIDEQWGKEVREVVLNEVDRLINNVKIRHDNYEEHSKNDFSEIKKNGCEIHDGLARLGDRIKSCKYVNFFSNEVFDLFNSIRKNIFIINELLLLSEKKYGEKTFENLQKEFKIAFEELEENYKKLKELD